MRPFGAKSVHWFRSYKHFAEEVKFSRYDHISQLTTKKFVFNLLWGVRGGPNDMDPPWYQQGRLFWACQQKKKFSKFSYPVYPESSHCIYYLKHKVVKILQHTKIISISIWPSLTSTETLPSTFTMIQLGGGIPLVELENSFVVEMCWDMH